MKVEQTLVEQTQNDILKYIAEHQDEKRLPKEQELGDLLGVSRVVVREALSRIRALGLIETKRKLGTVIVSPKIFGSLSSIVTSGQLERQTMKDLYELRLMIEIGMSDFLFLNKTEAGMKKLEAIVAKQFILENKLTAAQTEDEKYEIAKQLTEIDVKFHSALFEMTGNKSLMDFQSILRHLFTLYVPKLHKDYHDITLVSHISLYNILRTGTADALNVRTGPSTDYAVAAELAQGKVVKVLGTQDGWYQIGSGYIDAAYTEAATYEEALEQLYIRVTQGPLNIRSGPGTGYSKVGSLAKGRCVKVVSVQSGWYQIEQGYVSAAYVEETDYTPAAASGKGQELANIALQYVGYSYVYGGGSPRVGFDCSGLVQYACAQLGYSINRTASAQLQNGVTVSWDELAPGDLVFFKKPGSTTSKPVTHVGMYIGSGQFVHASDYGVGVIVSNLSDAYYTTGYVSARRIAV